MKLYVLKKLALSIMAMAVTAGLTAPATRAASCPAGDDLISAFDNAIEERRAWLETVHWDDYFISSDANRKLRAHALLLLATGTDLAIEYYLYKPARAKQPRGAIRVALYPCKDNCGRGEKLTRAQRRGYNQWDRQHGVGKFTRWGGFPAFLRDMPNDRQLAWAEGYLGCTLDRTIKADLPQAVKEKAWPEMAPKKDPAAPYLAALKVSPPQVEGRRDRDVPQALEVTGSQTDCPFENTNWKGRLQQLYAQLPGATGAARDQIINEGKRRAAYQYAYDGRAAAARDPAVLTFLAYCFADFDCGLDSGPSPTRASALMHAASIGSLSDPAVIGPEFAGRRTYIWLHYTHPACRFYLPKYPEAAITLKTALQQKARKDAERGRKIREELASGKWDPPAGGAGASGTTGGTHDVFAEAVGEVVRNTCNENLRQLEAQAKAAAAASCRQMGGRPGTPQVDRNGRTGLRHADCNVSRAKVACSF